MSAPRPDNPKRSGIFVLQVLAMFLPFALVACAVTFYFYQAAQDSEIIGNRAREAAGIELGNGAISHVLEEIRRDLCLVSEHYALKNFLDRSAPAEIYDFEQDMLNLSSSSRWYDQIRWLDETGMERVRVNFNGGNPVIVPVKELQNKRQRYYFADTFKLGRGEVYISPLDLNIEHDQVTIPPKPMLRMGTPVFDSHGDKRGIVLLNFFGVELLSRFGQATAAIADHAMLLNRDGYWLKSPRPDEEWGFMFGREQLTLAQRHPSVWRRIMQADSGQFEDADALWTFRTIYPLREGQPIQDGSATALAPSRDALDARKFFWKAVARLPPEALYAHTRAIRKPTAAVLAVLLGLLFAGCGKLVRARHRRNAAEAEVRLTNRNLERLVEERTAQLQADIAERKRAEVRLRQAAAVFESACEGIIVTGADQRIQMVNPAFSELTGYTEAEVIGQTPALLSSGRHDRNFYAELWGSVNTSGHWQGEIWNRRKNGEVYPELLSISAVNDQSGQITHYVGVFADISQLKATESQLEFLAHHDPLTRLPNRLLLLSRLEHGIEVARRENRQLALLMLDLDRFKDVNDSFGHMAGDELLQQVGERLTTRLRGVDTVSRLGGDEFTVLLEDIAHPEDAARVADSIIAALGEPWRLPQSGEVRIGVSVGISLFPQHGNTAAELLQHADAALYQAKAEGRGRFKYFSENLTRAARERIALEARLRRVIQEGELRVFYQPQVDIATGRIVGAEALLRWQDPLEGLIQPCNFIPVAEATGLIGAIGAWVLRETCLQGVRWIEAGLPPLILAVNLSPHQFLHSDIAAVVASTLAETGFPAANLELELTESALMEREDDAVEILNRLRAIGVRLAIDDFGTGYSSLAYLKRFPLDVLKIDKSFVDDIPHSQDDMQIAATIVAMAHTLRLKVVAEGVETAEQLAFLRTQGCDVYQGYFISPPVPAEALEGLLRESP